MEEVFMNSDPKIDILITAIRCVMAVIVNRSQLKFLAFSFYLLFCVMIFMMQPIGVQARDISNMNASPDEAMSQLKSRLNLTQEQEAKMRPIIEESIQKRHEIVRNGPEDRKAVKSQLQELRWSTDMQIGKVLTEAQMKEYQKLLEEQKEKAENNDTQHGRKSRYGGLRGF
jgi:Spy/CpxP family protein refolding chaperone